MTNEERAREADRENILVPLLLAYPAEFDAIPDALRPAVRRLILAAARAERGRVPVQPTHIDADGVLRFRANAIVRFLLDAGPFDMNTIGCMSFSDADRAQFAQLIGYSVSGYGDLSYVSDADYERAAALAAVRAGNVDGNVEAPLSSEG